MGAKFDNETIKMKEGQIDRGIINIAAASFDNETIKMKEGQNLMDVLKDALKQKGQADRMDSENGLFFIDNVTVKSINGDEVLLEVEYEYGG